MELRTVRRMFRIYVNTIFRQFGAFSQLFIGKNPSDSRTSTPSINVIQFNSRVLVSPVFKFEIYIIKPLSIAENVYPERKPFSKVIPRSDIWQERIIWCRKIFIY